MDTRGVKGNNKEVTVIFPIYPSMMERVQEGKGVFITPVLDYNEVAVKGENGRIDHSKSPTDIYFNNHKDSDGKHSHDVFVPAEYIKEAVELTRDSDNYVDRVNSKGELDGSKILRVKAKYDYGKNGVQPVWQNGLSDPGKPGADINKVLTWSFEQSQKAREAQGIGVEKDAKALEVAAPTDVAPKVPEAAADDFKFEF